MYNVLLVCVYFMFSSSNDVIIRNNDSRPVMLELTILDENTNFQVSNPCTSLNCLSIHLILYPLYSLRPHLLQIEVKYV